MQTEVTDSGLILKTAQDRETQFRNRKADRQPQALEFGLKFILNLQVCSLHTDRSAVKRILVATAPSLGCLFLSSPGRP